jgi:hypothetical protein
VDWGESSIDRCPTYGVYQVCCSSGPTGRRCVKCEVHNVIYICILIVLKDNKGEEITRMIDAQWILRIFEARHLNAQANRVQVTPTVDPWGWATMGWIKNRLTEKYKEEKNCDNDFPLNQVRVLYSKKFYTGQCGRMNNSLTTGVCWRDKLTEVRRGNVTT